MNDIASNQIHGSCISQDEQQNRLFDGGSYTIESQLEYRHLELLLSKFQVEARKYSDVNTLGSASDDESRDVTRTKYRIDKASFGCIIVDLLSPINGSQLSKDTLAADATLMFDKIDHKNKGLISMDDVCSYLVLQLKRNESRMKQNPFTAEPFIRKFSGLKDNIVKIVSDASRLLFLTKDGQINVLSSKLSVTKTFFVQSASDLGNLSTKRRTKQWITDCVLIGVINKLVVATANRTLQFYDVSSPNYVQQFHLYGLPHTVLCLHYHYTKLIPHDELWLFFGTDRGAVHLLTFHMANKSLFETPFKKSDSCWKISFKEISAQSKHVTHRLFSHMHSDWVKRILYVAEGDLLFSCSYSARDSLIYRSIDEKKRKAYVFKVTKGIECFDYNKSFNVLATGGVDHILRLWDPYVTSKPMAILKTHQTSIIDVMIYDPLKQVFSYSQDGILYAWDIKDHTPLQCITLKFPSNGVPFEHCHFPICLTHNNIDGGCSTLMIAAEDCVAEVKLLSRTKCTRNVSHKSSLVSVSFSSQNGNVISMSETGELITWSLSTGKKILDLHVDNTNNKPDEVSAFAIDENAHYAVTGFRDGSGVLWNLLTGAQEKVLLAHSEEEITNVVVLPKATQIFMLGWSKKILAYKNTKKLTTLRADASWLSVEAHKDDIISAEYWRPRFLATGTFDGDIFIWNIEYGRLWKKIQIGRSSEIFISKILAHGLLRSSRSARSGRRKARPELRTTHFCPSAAVGCYPPVEFLLYLHARNHESYATLVAVQGNTINFWSTIATGKPVASFSIIDNLDIVITAIAADRDCENLIVADSQSIVYVWDIKAYGVFRHFSRVVADIKNKQKTPILKTCFERPPLNFSWLAHENDNITSLVCGCHNDVVYVLTGTTGGRVSVFSVIGQCVGIFHEDSEWGLDEMKINCDRYKDMLANDSQTMKDDSESIAVETNKGEESEKCGFFPSLVMNDRNMSRDHHLSSLTEDAAKMKTTDTYKTRCLIHDVIEHKKESLSVLGETYNTNFKQRLEGRRYRRRLSHHNNNTTTKKVTVFESHGMNNQCLPFKALLTKDCEDYILPEGLPITPRMRSYDVNPYNSAGLDNINFMI